MEELSVERVRIGVNQSGSVVLSTEAMRGAPWRNSLIIMALSTPRRKLRTRESWVQVLPGGPNSQRVAAMQPSSFVAG